MIDGIISFFRFSKRFDVGFDRLVENSLESHLNYKKMVRWCRINHSGLFRRMLKFYHVGLKKVRLAISTSNKCF